MHNLVLVTAPVAEPVTLQEARAQLNVEIDDDDALINRLIRSGRDSAENYLGRRLVTQEWDINLPQFPLYSYRVPIYPIQSILSYKRRASPDAALVELDPSKYQYFAGYNLITLLNGSAYNWVEHPTAAVIRVRAGYGGADEVPEVIKQAILLTVGTFYAHREDVVMGAVSPLPMGARQLMAPERVYRT